jgi:hypothetical protein
VRRPSIVLVLAVVTAGDASADSRWFTADVIATDSR